MSSPLSSLGQSNRLSSSSSNFNNNDAVMIRSNNKRKVPSMIIFILTFGFTSLWNGLWNGFQQQRHNNPFDFQRNPDYNNEHLLYLIGNNNKASESSSTLFTNRTKALALPNVHNVIDDIEKKRKKANYGGIGDSPHLGGFASTIDIDGISPTVWKNMIRKYNIKSVLDLGCGRAFAASWFMTHGVRTLGVDGSTDAINRSAIPIEKRSELLVEHDFSRGPWWPAETYDAVWSVDFMENVGINYMKNYLPTLQKAAIIFMTTSQWGGWHHVEVHPDNWWIRKYETFGLHYSEELTNEVRDWAKEEQNSMVEHPFQQQQQQQKDEKKSTYSAQHIWFNMKVFINPAISSLPEHDHLFYEPGCFESSKGGLIKNRECGEKIKNNEESIVPDSYRPFLLTPGMDIQWENLVLRALNTSRSVTDALISSLLRKKPIDYENMNLDDKAWKERSLPPQELPEILQRIINRNFTDMQPIPVLHWPYSYAIEGEESPEYKHIEENGTNESLYLILTKDLENFNPNIVWVGDTGWGKGWFKWCEEFLKVILVIMDIRLERGLSPRWPIIIVDFTDQTNKKRCVDIELLMGSEYVHYTKRSVGEGREWKKETNWIHFGRRSNTTIDDGLEYMHTPLVARTDTVKLLKQTLETRGLNLTYPIETLGRETDVIHLWPKESKTTRSVNSVYCFLRDKVSAIIVEMEKEHNFKAFVGIAGKALKAGRQDVSDAYIDLLLDTKITVLAQRDNWEDHYRLMEALVSGTCVITDFMHGLPAGLKNGTNILVYKSARELENLILYYLAHDKERIEIGRKGRNVAMSRHRAWHRMEEIVFGEILSTCESKKPGGNCPYIVHGNENR